jgi:hypothetical protein
MQGGERRHSFLVKKVYSVQSPAECHFLDRQAAFYMILCTGSAIRKTKTRSCMGREFSLSAAAETPAAEEPEDRHDDDSGNGAAKDVYYVLADWGALV